MMFNSVNFIIFFCILYAVFLSLYLRNSSLEKQNILLLAASYIFYSAWDYKFLSLILMSTLVDYVLSQKIFKSNILFKKKIFLIMSLVFNLSLLCVFKYLNFGIESFVYLLNLIGFSINYSLVSIVLPVGISFYTFQTISYTIDVYRGELEPTQNFVDFALYVSFFPQLVAGPIEKGTQLLPQLQRSRIITKNGILIGLYWIIIGFFKKIVIADTLAPIVDYTFSNYNTISGISSLLGLLAFSLQIYGDFAGYTYVARGVSKLLGIDLMKNFDRPYLATSPSEFWHRWHISLSLWLRNYLYISLGGNRKGKLRKYFNLVLTMVIGGLWHGASWNFVAWGLYHGLILLVDHAIQDYQKNKGTIRADHETIFIRTLRVIGMYILTLFGWLLFRVDSIGQAKDILHNIFTNFYWSIDALYFLPPVLVLYILLFSLHIFQEYRKNEFLLSESSPIVVYCIYLFMLFSISIVGIKPAPFIYFQF